jgi:phosphoglycolate phosphatase-like HAD superfamily hydrolase
MIKGIIFDLDGTLVRLPIKYDKIFTKLQNLFDTQDEFRPLIPTIIKKANNDSKLVEKAFNIICEEEVIAANNFKAIDDSVNIINYFKSKNYSLCLVTMQCMNAAKIILDKMQILELFSSIVTRDVLHERHLQIKKSIDVLSLSTNEIIMVGDRINDVKSAKQVGCPVILFNKDKLNSFTECQVISNLSELKKLIS